MTEPPLPPGPPPAYQPYPTTPPPPATTPAPRRRLPLVLAVLAAVLVLLGVVLVPLALVGGADEPADLSEVVVHEDLSNEHTEDDVTYETVPPAGGRHADVWLDCGTYDEPVRDENAVHDLEHGTVWITYRPDLDDDDVATLEDALPQNGILSPYDDLPAPVVVTVWGRQLRLDGPDDPRLALFVEEYAGGVTAPEPMASCAGGSRDPAGTGGTEV
ncbi:DUF3105 domain-containing protein [Nocardioides dongkuii]|uniref:DUF3105 domain-containing protein n=1 Tax=Nocardioides dongkuii TaxID=2760089 RepID=UPI0015FC382E|nr:DUF3105 domain-containing protein [Nocardioides dongkuii]